MIKQIVSIGVVGLTLVAAVVFAGITQTDAKKDDKPKDSNEKVLICHSTQSQPSNGGGAGPQNNPYNPIEVSIDATGPSGLGDHYENHTGPVFNNTNQDFWGDIIPPIGDQPGLNWTELGQAIYNNDCAFPKKVATASVSVLPATCEAGQKLVYGDIKYADFSGTPNGTFGPASYSVTATAKKDALFAGLTTTKTFTGTLSGPLTGEQCGETEYDTAAAGVRFVAATCQAGEQLLYSDEDLTNARWDESSTPSGTTGPADFTVTAYANEGAKFAEAENVFEGGYIQVFSGELDGPLTGEECEETEYRTAVAGVRIIAATCESPAQLLYGDEDVTYASFDGNTPSGTTGPAEYEVFAYASEGARFAPAENVSEDGIKKTFTGTLEGVLTGDECVLGETPETPEVLPETNAATPVAVIAAMSAATALVAGLGVGLRSLLGRQL